MVRSKRDLFSRISENREANDPSIFNEDYFERGPQTGVSGYENYRWIPDLTFPAVHDMIKHVGLELDDRVLDFGCAKGFYVKAMKLFGYDAWGCDISSYAIDEVDSAVRKRCRLMESPTHFPFERNFDLVYAKDVFEHLTPEQALFWAELLRQRSERLFLAIPLGENGKYRIPSYENDATHIIREDENWWNNLFESAGWQIEKFDHRMGHLKQHWLEAHPRGNGFWILKK